MINYKPLNKVLQWIRYPIPNKKDLIQRIYNATIFSKFDMKSGFWQIQIKPEDRYKTTFTVPFGHYEWNVMPFGLKNAPSEFQNMMNDIFNNYTKFSIVYIDDVQEILQKDVQNLVSKQIFARWQAILSVFDFEIEFIKGSSNVLPDFLSWEFL